jgi:two-component system chemotaxis response regulator CheB
MAPRIVIVTAPPGGLPALRDLIARLPRAFPLPVIIAGHGGGDERRSLEEASRRRLIEPEDKEEILPGAVYLSPPDYLLLVERGHFALSTEEASAQTASEALCESAIDAYGGDVIRVILSGLEDGEAALSAGPDAKWVIIPPTRIPGALHDRCLTSPEREKE